MVLIETAYHDNPEDAQWIRDHVDEIARSLSRSVAVYLGVPFIEPGREEPLVEAVPVSGTAHGRDDGAAMTYFERERPYRVRSGRGAVYLRQRPEASAPSLGLVPSGETVQVKGHGRGWGLHPVRAKEGYMDARKLYKE